MSTDAAVRRDVVFPPPDLQSLGELARFAETSGEPALLVGPTGERVLLPPEVYQVLVQVVRAMRGGRAISLAPTTQQAANFLGISRPTLVKLLEAGEIPFDRPGRHRRVGLLDLLAYQSSRRSDRKEALRRLTTDASELGLYEGPAEDYESALQESRRKLSGRART